MSPTFGGGTGTPVPLGIPGIGGVCDASILAGIQLGLTLDRYQELMRFPIAAFNGLYKAEEEGCYDCAAIWKQTDRDAFAIAIAQAEEMRERELGYHVAPKYINDERYDYAYPSILIKKHLIAVGSKATSTIQFGVPLVLSVAGVINDPVVISVPTTVTVVSEIKVYYPGEDVEIHPSSIIISGGNAIICIPRSRLVDHDVDTNCEPPPMYTDDSNFINTVDVKRVYTDPNDGAFFVCGGDCGCVNPLCSYCAAGFTETHQQAYPNIESRRLSIVRLCPGSYSGGAWTPTLSLCCDPTRISISYLSGIENSMYTEMITLRLAHTLLPTILPDRIDLCSGCWKGDMERDENTELTPYGDTRGAVNAWIADSRSKVVTGFVNTSFASLNM